MMMPIIDITLRVPLVMKSESATPRNDSGSDNMIANGCRNDPNSEARMR